jgi:hypothetical protein
VEREASELNDVTFVYPAFESAPTVIVVVGTFSNLFQPCPFVG